MIALAREIYSDNPINDPGELLDDHKFSTTRDLEERLLEAFIPAIYAGPPQDQRARWRRTRHWDSQRALVWLGYIARHLSRLGLQDLAWWQMGDTIPRLIRFAAYFYVGAIFYGFLAILFGVSVLGNHGMNLIGPALVLGVIAGDTVALSGGALSNGVPPTYVHLRIRGRIRVVTSKVWRRMRFTLIAFLIPAVVIGYFTPAGVEWGLALFLSFAPGAALALSIAGGLETPDRHKACR